jgi:hypothetical protein
MRPGGPGLTDTLALHEQPVHRDVNPRNIIFARGLGWRTSDCDRGAVRPDLIGTLYDLEVRTPEGDLYSFGKLLYVTATGREPKQMGEGPTDRAEDADLPVFRELQAIWRKACHRDRRHRYRDARAIHAELLALQAGASVLRLKRVERVFGWLRRYGLGLLVLAGLLGVGRYFQARAQNQAPPAKIGAGGPAWLTPIPGPCCGSAKGAGLRAEVKSSIASGSSAAQPSGGVVYARPGGVLPAREPGRHVRSTGRWRVLSLEGATL